MKLPKRFGKKENMGSITIADVAKKANVSLSTASYALNNKPGVGKKTRERILKIARELNYSPNSIAASLKRSSFNIIISLPILREGYEYFFSFINDGIRDCVAEFSDYGITLIHSPYDPKIKGSQKAEIIKASRDVSIDGIITNDKSDEEAKAYFSALHKSGIPIVLVGGDDRDMDRLAFVAPHYFITGKIIAQLISQHLEEDDKLLLLAGERADISHSRVVEGIETYFREQNITNPILKLYGNNGEALSALLEEERTIKAAASVSARSTYLLGSTLEALESEVYAIGSDLYRESRTYLEEGIFDAIIQKNPYRASYYAMRILLNKIIKGQNPVQDTSYTASEIIIKSNLPLYTDGPDKAVF